MWRTVITPHIQLHISLYQTVDVAWYQWNGEVNLRLCPLPSSPYMLLPLQPPYLSTLTQHPIHHHHPLSSLLSCHVCESEGFGGWHSDGVKPDGSHKAGDVAQSDEGCTHTHTHPYTITHLHFLFLMNSHELFITHTCTHASHRAHTQLLSATEGSATSLYFIIISLGIFLGCKGIPGGARPLKLSTPPPTSLLFPPPCTLSLVFPLRLSPCHPLSVCFSVSLMPLPLSPALTSPLFSSWVGCVTGLNRERERGQKQTRERIVFQELWGEFTWEKCLRGFSPLLLIQSQQLPGVFIVPTDSVDYLFK